MQIRDKVNAEQNLGDGDGVFIQIWFYIVAWT